MPKRKKDLRRYGSSAQAPALKALDIRRGIDRPGDGLEKHENAIAALSIRPEATAARALRKYQGKEFGEPEISALLANLKKTCDAVKSGDMSGIEAMLVAQMITTDAIFSRMATWAIGQPHTPHMEMMLRIALKAQANSRATAQTLIEVKYPRQVQFVRQQNIAGNQQINNGDVQAVGSRAGEEKTIGRNKLLEAVDAKRMDARTPGATGLAYPRLEAVV